MVSREEATTIALEKGSSLWRDAWLRLRRNRLAVLSIWVLGLIVAASVIGPFFSPYTYDAQDIALGASPPSWQHWLGTDELGRDLLTRMLYGGRISLMVGIAATAVSLIIGVLYGATAGLAGGRVDQVMMRLVDVLYALPFTIFVIILVVLFGRNFFLVFVAIGFVEWLTMARIVRSQVLSVRRQEYIEACRVMGLRPHVILLRHVVPNTLGAIIVYATLTVPIVILLEAFLSFLGLGVQAPMSSWGLLISDGASVMEDYPWLLIAPSIALSLTLFSLNFLGDGLRDALDPRVSKE